MPGKFAIDFGTTNTVVARWNDAVAAAETVRLEGLSVPPTPGGAFTVPTQLYVRDARAGDVLAGHQVRSAGYNIRSDPRYFTAFKRPLVSEIQGLSRELDGAPVGFSDAGRLFLGAVIRQLEAQKLSPDELVVTLPVDSFERYTQWLEGALEALELSALHVVDESTAAALGYEVAGSESLVLVFDFGGGTLDVSLVRLGLLSGDEVGTVVRDKRGRKGRGAAPAPNRNARVIAKAGQVLGGDDIDAWIVEDVLARHQTPVSAVKGIYNQLKATAEEVKVRLSSEQQAEFSVFDPDEIRTFSHTYTRSELEDVLEKRGFYRRIQECIRKVLRQAEGAGITEESIQSVLLVGGTSLIPSVQRAVGQNFEPAKIKLHKPFEAVAHGALRVAVGTQIEDHIYHSYGVRHLNPITRRHEYEPFLRGGSKYPLDKPLEQVLAAAHPNQRAIELVIGEITEDSTVREVIIEDGRIVTNERAGMVRRVVPLNDKEGARTVAVLDPPGVPGVDRIKVYFNVDRKRTLRITVEDLLSKKKLLEDVRVIELR
jgi:molecular chaperone DnaK (HSP70)